MIVELCPACEEGLIHLDEAELIWTCDICSFQCHNDGQQTELTDEELTQ